MVNLIPLVFRLKIILWVFFFCGEGNRITFIVTILSAIIYVHSLQLDTVERLFTKKIRLIILTPIKMFKRKFQYPGKWGDG